MSLPTMIFFFVFCLIDSLLLFIVELPQFVRARARAWCSASLHFPNVKKGRQIGFLRKYEDSAELIVDNKVRQINAECTLERLIQLEIR